VAREVCVTEERCPIQGFGDDWGSASFFAGYIIVEARYNPQP